MLRFAENPDIIFTEILELAFEDALEWELYSNKALKSTIAELKEKNRSPGLWRLTDYHYALIYDVLSNFVDVHNDFARETGQPILELQDHRIFRINLNALIDQYFYDTDFLLDPQLMLNMPSELKGSLGFSAETFGVVMGLKPHSKELRIELYEEGEFKPSLLGIKQHTWQFSC